jgi:hypothetical protein
MFLYTVIEAMAGIVAFILLVVCTRKNDGVVYNKLDKLGRITNILLIPIYACVLPFCLLLGMISYPAYDGFLGIIGWIVAIINASATLFCGLGLGFSVALRKKGKSKLGFTVQFAGLVGIAFTIVMYMLFEGNLLQPLN